MSEASPTVTPGPVSCWECQGTIFIPVVTLLYDENLHLVEPPKGYACPSCGAHYSHDLLRVTTAWQQSDDRLAHLQARQTARGAALEGLEAAPAAPAAPAPPPGGGGDGAAPLEPGAVACWACDSTYFTPTVTLRYDDQDRLITGHVGHACCGCKAVFDRDLLRAATVWLQQSRRLGHLAEQAHSVARRLAAAAPALVEEGQGGDSPQ